MSSLFPRSFKHSGSFSSSKDEDDAWWLILITVLICNWPNKNMFSSFKPTNVPLGVSRPPRRWNLNTGIWWVRYLSHATLKPLVFPLKGMSTNKLQVSIYTPKDATICSMPMTSNHAHKQTQVMSQRDKSIRLPHKATTLNIFPSHLIDLLENKPIQLFQKLPIDSRPTCSIADDWSKTPKLFEAHYALSGLPYKAQIFIHTLNCYLGECEAAVWIYTSRSWNNSHCHLSVTDSFLLCIYLQASAKNGTVFIEPRFHIYKSNVKTKKPPMQMCLLLEPVTQNTLKVEEIKSRYPQKLWTIILEQITNPSNPWSYRPDPRVCRQ